MGLFNISYNVALLYNINFEESKADEDLNPIARHLRKEIKSFAKLCSTEIKVESFRCSKFIVLWYE